MLVHAPIRAGGRGTVDAAVAYLDSALKAVVGLDHVVSPRDEGGEGLRGPDGHTALFQYSTTVSDAEWIEVGSAVQQSVSDSAEAYPALDIEHVDGASSSWPWRKTPAPRSTPSRC